MQADAAEFMTKVRNAVAKYVVSKPKKSAAQQTAEAQDGNGAKAAPSGLAIETAQGL
jgi:hypothetical protein